MKYASRVCEALGASSLSCIMMPYARIGYAVQRNKQTNEWYWTRVRSACQGAWFSLCVHERAWSVPPALHIGQHNKRGSTCTGRQNEAAGRDEGIIDGLNRQELLQVI